VVSLLAAASCTTGATKVGNAVLPSVSPSGSAFTYAAIGASETVGIGANDPPTQAWPAVFYRSTMPRSAVYLNVGIPGATVAEALKREVPEALRAHPRVVSVFLNANDARSGVSPGDYQQQLTTLLRQVRQGGSAEVLVANMPPLQDLPVYTSCQPYAPASNGGCDTSVRVTPADVTGLVDAYNRAIAEAAAATGATVVDLHALAESKVRNGTEASFIAQDGFHPNTAGHGQIARAFAAAYRPVA
jgi:lysophospholipase L1-like esterase